MCEPFHVFMVSVVYKAANKHVGHRLEMSATWRPSDMMQAFIVVLINGT